jgi:hypothetical protein
VQFVLVRETGLSPEQLDELKVDTVGRWLLYMQLEREAADQKARRADPNRRRPVPGSR